MIKNLSTGKYMNEHVISILKNVSVIRHAAALDCLQEMLEHVGKNIQDVRENPAFDPRERTIRIHELELMKHHLQKKYSVVYDLLEEKI